MMQMRPVDYLSYLPGEAEAVLWFHCAEAYLPLPGDAMLSRGLLQYAAGRQRPLPFRRNTPLDTLSVFMRGLYRTVARLRCVSRSFYTSPASITPDSFMCFVRTQFPFFQGRTSHFISVEVDRFLQQTMNGSLLATAAQCLFAGGLDEYRLTEVTEATAQLSDDMILAGLRPVPYAPSDPQPLFLAAREHPATGAQALGCLGAPFVVVDGYMRTWEQAEVRFLDEIPLLRKDVRLYRILHRSTPENKPGRSRTIVQYKKASIKRWIRRVNARRIGMKSLFEAAHAALKSLSRPPYH